MRNPARILVVDDIADNVEILRMRLESLGYEVGVAVDGEQALEKVRAELPDLVLLDIMMPKIDGLEVVRRIKADASLPFIPVILVTAKATPKDVVAGLDAGGDDYLTKPIDHGALVARVRAMLRIKAIPELAAVPIVAVTSYALSGDEAKTKAAGCDSYIAKPYSPRQMLAKVREILGA